MNKELYVILYDIRSAYNVGAIFRSADGAGVSKIFIGGYTPLPASHDKLYQTKVEKMLAKTALGAEHSVAWEKFEDLNLLIEKLRNKGVFIAALEKTDQSQDLTEFEKKYPMALIVGNEVDGVSQEVLDKCNAIVALPMRGIKESLNVSVATGIAMYELLK